MATVVYNAAHTGIITIREVVDFSNALSQSATQIVLENTDGSRLLINGTGFTFDVNGDPTGGTITSMQYTSSDQLTVYADFTGLSGSLVDTYAAINATSVGDYTWNSAGTVLFSGSDTLTINALGDETVGMLFSAFQGTDTLNGGSGRDLLFAGSGADTIFGNDGDDFLAGREGNDSIDGGNGFDTISFINDVEFGGTNPVTVTFTGGGAGTAVDGFGTTDTFAGIEAARGTAGNDTFIGGTGFNRFQGLDGVDTFDGTIGGADEIDYSRDQFYGGTNGVTVHLGNNTATDGFGNSDILTSIERVRGTNFDDTLTGSSGDNRLRGEGGNDIIEGLEGDDTIEGGFGFDTVSYASASASVTVNLNDDNGSGIPGGSASGAAGNDTLISIENISGSAFGDDLRGNSFANTIFGGDGRDSLRGRAGDDVLDGGNGSDRADYINASGSVTVYLTDDTGGGHTGGGSSGADGNDTLVDIERIRGSNFDDTLYGNSGVNDLRGAGGADALYGGGGFDFASYRNSSIALVISLANPGSNTGEAAGDSYFSIEGLVGTQFADTITGDAGDNRLDGAAGGDTLDGGNGNDIARYQTSDVGLTVNLADPLQNTGDAVGDTYISIEGLMGSDFDDTLTGDANNNTLIGDDGADVLNGGIGFDIASYRVNDIDTGVNANLASAGTNTGHAAGDVYNSIEGLEGSKLDDTLTGDAAANFLSGRRGNDTLNGGAGNDTIYGGEGDDTLNGGDDADLLLGRVGTNTMAGGDGDDRYYSQGTNDVITEAAGEGYDIVYAYGDLGLAAGSEVEYLASRATTGISITANEFDQKLVSGSLGDTLNGEAGSDILVGNDGDDVLNGGADGDRLYGGSGTNTMAGGDGDDLYYVQGSGDVVTEAAGEGFDVIYAFTDVTLAAGSEVEYMATAAASGISITGSDTVQNMISAGNGDTMNGAGGEDILIGQGGNDVLLGGADNDRLYGGTGTNTMSGGAGDDFIYAQGTNDVVIEAVGEGYDIVYTYGDIALGAGSEVEYIASAAGSAITINGNEFDQKLVSGGQGDTLNGGGGNDILVGGGGNDDIIGGDGTDRLYGGTGTNTLAGGDGNDTYNVVNSSDTINEAAGEGFDTVYLYAASANFVLPGGSEVERVFSFGSGNANLTGNGFAQLIVGGSGDDTIEGGGGADTLRGGAGADAFRFLSIYADAADIQDFSGSGLEGDVLQFSAADFGVAAGALPGDRFGDFGAVLGHNNPALRFEAATGRLYYDPDGDIAGGEVLVATLGAAALTGADIELL